MALNYGSGENVWMHPPVHRILGWYSRPSNFDLKRNIKEANQIIGLNNFYIGIGGVLTFKNSNLDKTIQNINNEYLLLETDSPYLTPTPYRGIRNESKHIIEIAKKLAEIKNISIEEVSRFTNENANRLFKI